MNDDQTRVPQDLPVLTEVVDGDELPVLTEVVEEDWLTLPPTDAPPVDEATPQHAPAMPPEMQTQLEALFMERLLPRLEAARREAIARTLTEFRQELPQLLRDAQDSRPPTD
ncbi:MAG: hypothetical protein AB1722_03620 [Pseudomonadota bacterium]